MLKIASNTLVSLVLAALIWLPFAVEAQTSNQSSLAKANEQQTTREQQVASSEQVSSSEQVLGSPQITPVETKNPAGITGSAKPSSAAQLANLVGGLALILVLIFGLSWFVKRFSQGGFAQNPAIKIVASMPLGTRERLMLVEIGGKQILLGVTATQISTLQTFDHPVVSAGDKEQGSDFSQKLMAILQQKNISQPGDSSRGQS